MPLTFGSVGDVIAVALLVKDVLNALDSSRGAAPEYQELTRELYILERVLLEVEHMIRECSRVSELSNTCDNAARGVADCRTTVENFLKRIKKYKKTLSKDTKAHAVTRTVMKITWSMVDKEEVLRFRGEIMTHTGFLNMLLSSANLKLMQIHQQQLTTSLSQSSTSTLNLLTSHGAALIEIRDHVHGNNAILSQQATTLARIHDRIDENTSLLRRLNTCLLDIRGSRLTKYSRAWDTLVVARRLGAILVRAASPYLWTGLECVLAGIVRVIVARPASSVDGEVSFIVLGIASPQGLCVALYHQRRWTVMTLFSRIRSMPYKNDLYSSGSSWRFRDDFNIELWIGSCIRGKHFKYSLSPFPMKTHDCPTIQLGIELEEWTAFNMEAGNIEDLCNALIWGCDYNSATWRASSRYLRAPEPKSRAPWPESVERTFKDAFSRSTFFYVGVDFHRCTSICARRSIMGTLAYTHIIPL